MWYVMTKYEGETECRGRFADMHEAVAAAEVIDRECEPIGVAVWVQETCPTGGEQTIEDTVTHAIAGEHWTYDVYIVREGEHICLLTGINLVLAARVQEQRAKVSDCAYLANPRQLGDGWWSINVHTRELSGWYCTEDEANCRANTVAVRGGSVEK